jgi:outer membrane protein assembly factor BamA
LIQYRDASESFRDASRFALSVTAERPVGSARFVTRTFAGSLAGGDSVPLQHFFFVGGPTSSPGYRFHEFASRSAFSERVEMQFPVPFLSLSLGRYGRTPASLTLAPYGNAAWIDGNGWRPSVGLGVLSLFDLLRLDVARGLRDGRWTFSADVSREFWSIL